MTSGELQWTCHDGEITLGEMMDLRESMDLTTKPPTLNFVPILRLMKSRCTSPMLTDDQWRAIPVSMIKMVYETKVLPALNAAADSEMAKAKLAAAFSLSDKIISKTKQ